MEHHEKDNKQAIHQRRPKQDQLVHHSDRGSQYLSIKYTERLAEAKIAPSVGSVGDSYDNATLEWVDWFNSHRLLEPTENILPAEAEANFYAVLEGSDMAA